MKSTLSAAALLLPALHAAAHEGHGLLAASHWHATDTLGLLLAAALVAGVTWWSRRK